MEDRLVKKVLAIGIIVLFIGSNIVSGLNIQLKNTINPLISARGNTLYVGGSGPKNYSKIHQHNNQGDVLTITDLINDVVLNYGKIVPRPNIDISSISCIKTGGEVEITLTLIETGKIQDNQNIVYYIYLITSKNEYEIAFSNGECIVCDTNGDELEGVQYLGIGTTTLSISFNLVNYDEDLLEIMGMALEIEGTDSYYSDVCPNPERKAFIFGKYSNLYTEDDFITIDAVNIQMIMFKPFQRLNYIAGEQIIFLKDYLGIITKQFIIGFFNVFGVYQRKTIRDYSTKYNLKIGAPIIVISSIISSINDNY